MDGWMDKEKYRKMDGLDGYGRKKWMDGWIKQIDGWLEEKQKYEKIDGWLDGYKKIDGWLDGWLDGQKQNRWIRNGLLDG